MKSTSSQSKNQDQDADIMFGRISRAAVKLVLAALFGLIAGLGLVLLAESRESEGLSGDEIARGVRKELTRSLEQLPSHPIEEQEHLRIIERIDDSLARELQRRDVAESRAVKFLNTALREIGMGLIVAAFAVFGYELLRHVSGTVREAKKLDEGYQAISLATQEMQELVHRVRPVVGVPSDVAEGVTGALDKCASSRRCIERYHVEYELGRLREDGYREIHVSYSYQPISAWIPRKLRFRCLLTTTKFDTSPDSIDLPGYEFSWSFLPHATGELDALPADALSGIEVVVRRSGKRERVTVQGANSATQRCLEFETEGDVANLTRDDVISVKFTVLQSDDFSFVSDRVRHCVFDYNARCFVGQAAVDLAGVSAGEFLCTSADAPIDAADLRMVVVESRGWVLPRGGVSFSWTRKREVADLALVRGMSLPLRLDSPGAVFHLGAASDVARAVVSRLPTAKEVLNTFIVWEPAYSTETDEEVETAIATFVRRRDVRFEETCSTLGKRRVANLAKRFDGKLPDCYQVRVLKPSTKDMPACNFIIIKHHDAGPTSEEIFFGWGFFRGSSNESVFWSRDRALIAFFRDYHRALRSSEVSEAYRS